MGRIEKTVFLSYRRTNAPWALAIFQHLTHHGYDVFFDFMGIASGDFERVILGNIEARAHFLVLLTPSALERCGQPGDWLRREIETALEMKRNIVPLMLDGFDFNAPVISDQLTDRMAALKSYGALRVVVEYFEEAMGRLRDRYVNVALDAVLHPASPAAQQMARDQQAAAVAEPAVREEELTAQAYFERGFQATNPAEKMRFYSQAIRLKPDLAVAFYNRGNARAAQGTRRGRGTTTRRRFVLSRLKPVLSLS
jgi:tetratricopeptide (TPR) repeat protein